MNNQNLFEALINICGFTAIDDEMSAIKDAILKDFLTENIENIEVVASAEKIKAGPVNNWTEEDYLPF